MLQVINLLGDIAALHKGGLTILLESDCACSVEVVQSLVTLLYNVLKIHEERSDSILKISEEKPDSLSFSILQKGTLLLHQMYQHEVNFIRRHSSMQHQYVLLIQQLNRIFKNAGTELYDNESKFLFSCIFIKIAFWCLEINFIMHIVPKQVFSYMFIFMKQTFPENLVFI